MIISKDILNLAYDEPEFLIENYLLNGFFDDNPLWDYIDRFYSKFPYLSLIYLIEQSECEDKEFLRKFTIKHQDKIDKEANVLASWYDSFCKISGVGSPYDKIDLIKQQIINCKQAYEKSLSDLIAKVKILQEELAVKNEYIAQFNEQSSLSVSQNGLLQNALAKIRKENNNQIVEEKSGALYSLIMQLDSPIKTVLQGVVDNSQKRFGKAINSHDGFQEELELFSSIEKSLV